MTRSFATRQMPGDESPNMRKVGLAGFVICTLGIGMVQLAQAGGNSPPLEVVAEGGSSLETFKLADRSNLRHLSNGDFLFRLAREKRTGVVYWAYMGSTRHVVATVPDPGLLADDSAARAILLTVTDLPARVGCGIGLIHQSKVYVVPENAEYGETGYSPDVSPLYAVGEVRNDTSGRTPTTLLSYRNLLTGK